MEKGNILVIESNKATQNWIEALLKKAGYSVEIAGNGFDGMRFAARATHNLIIMDLVLSDTTGEMVYDSIRQNPMIGSVPFLIFAEKVDDAYMEKLREKGFDNFVEKKPDVEFELLRSIIEAIKEPQSIVPDVKAGRLISFFSAKGGNGTSTLCINIAHNLANQVDPKTVLVIDLALPMGTLAMMTGASPNKSIAEMASEGGSCDPEFIKECISRDEPWNFSFIHGSNSPQESQIIDPDQLNLLFASILTMYDYILVDLGKSLSRISLPILKRSDFVVAVFGADFVTVDLTLKTLAYLEDTGIHRTKVFPILNRAVGREGLTKAEIEDKYDLEIQRAIPFAENKMNHSINQQVPYAQEFPEDVVNLVLNDIAGIMIEHNTGMLNLD
jgi:MinD-like ATPase involved in chromosome partitioning or flagellar assembly